MQNNKEFYNKHYSFEKFKELFEKDFDPRQGQTCEHYYQNLVSEKISPIRLNIQFKEYEINLVDYVSDLGGIILSPKGKYEALRFKINDNIYLIHRRFRASTHYKFDNKFLKVYTN
jgi:hypothetical protein